MAIRRIWSTSNTPLIQFCDFLFDSDYRGIGELIVRIAYADALTKEEANDLMMKNEESVRLTTEALAKIYLVNFIPMRTLMSSLLELFIHSCATYSQIHPCVGTRRWVPAVSRPYQKLEPHNPQWTLGEGPQGYCELTSLWFVLYSRCCRTSGFADPAWRTN